MRNTPQNFYKKFLGAAGENKVSTYLKKSGCKILKRNYRTPFGEADIVVQDGEDIAFVEVKTRSTDSFSRPAEAVGARKRKKYVDIANYYMLGAEEETNIRFDVAEVTKEGINWIKNAFEC